MSELTIERKPDKDRFDAKDSAPGYIQPKLLKEVWFHTGTVSQACRAGADVKICYTGGSCEQMRNWLGGVLQKVDEASCFVAAEQCACNEAGSLVYDFLNSPFFSRVQ